jgi:hypothetical protein
MLSVKPTMADEQSISRVFNGVTLTGTYTLQDGIVTLRTAFGNKTAQLLGSDPDTLASIMLRELYQDIADPSSLVSRTINGEAQQPPSQ